MINNFIFYVTFELYKSWPGLTFPVLRDLHFNYEFNMKFLAASALFLSCIFISEGTGCVYWCKSSCGQLNIPKYYCCSYDPKGRHSSFLPDPCNSLKESGSKNVFPSSKILLPSFYFRYFRWLPRQQAATTTQLQNWNEKQNFLRN